MTSPAENIMIRELSGTLLINDDEMRYILRNAEAEAKAIMSHYGDNFSARVRQAQLDLARSQQELWSAVGRQTKVGIGDAADAAARADSFLTDVMMAGVGGSASFYNSAILSQARAGIPALLARRQNGISLSERVYKNAAFSSRRLEGMIDGLVVNGASAREIATRVRSLINPNTSGGVSYAAMRLGRTELNNAFHTSSANLNAPKPWVTGMKWRLSGSHPRPDVCNDYADKSFPHGMVPSKPHPNCLCTIYPDVVDEKQFVREFQNGNYDNYLDGIGCGAVA